MRKGLLETVIGGVGTRTSHAQVVNALGRAIIAGDYPVGTILPGDAELAARFKVSQGTVRKAIDELAAENLLLRRQGKGTFVATHAEKQVQFRFLKLVPDSGARGSEGPAQRDIIECRRTRASADIARALALRSGDPVLQVRRVLSFGAAPIILEDIWLPAAPFKGLTAERLANYQGPMYALFETEFNVRMVRADEKIRAIPATSEHQTLLRIATGTPLLSVERTAFTYRDEPMELRYGYYRTDTHYYHNALN